MRDASIPLRHFVAGRAIVAEPARTITVPAECDGFLPVTVPIATTAEVDDFVEELGPHLARWMARSSAERIHAVSRLARLLLDRRDEFEFLAESFGMASPDLSAQLSHSAQMVLDVVEAARANPAPPIGIAVLVIDSDRAGKLMLPLVAEVLVHGGVVVIVSNPILAGRASAVSGLLAGALPAGVLNEVHGDQETTDALISNPLVAAVFVDGDDHAVDQLIRLAELHRKPGIAYCR